MIITDGGHGEPRHKGSWATNEQQKLDERLSNDVLGQICAPQQIEDEKKSFLSLDENVNPD